MPMKPGHKVNKSDPTYLKNKEERAKRAARKKEAATLSKSPPVSEPDLTQSDEFILDPVQEARLNDPDSLHINQDGKENQAILKKWDLTLVPYFLIVCIIFHLKTYLSQYDPTLAASLNQYIDFVNKSNVGAVRLLVILYSQVNVELLGEVDLEFYVNQAQRHSRKLYGVNYLLPDIAFKEGVSHLQQTNASLLYNGRHIKSFDLFDEISAFFSKSDNLEVFGKVYIEFVGQNRINNCYSSLRPNYVWTLDISQFSFPNESLLLFIGLDLATRRIMHYDFFTNTKEPTARTVYESLIKSFKKHNVEPAILHTDQASYFFGDFENQLRLDFQNIQLSKTRLNMPKSQSRMHQNQAVEAFFSSYKKWLTKKHGDAFFSTSRPLQQSINLIRDGLKEVNATKEHRVLSNTPEKDYFNKIFLEFIRSSYSTNNKDSLSNGQIDQFVKSGDVLEGQIVSPETVSDLVSNETESDVIFINEDGVAFDKNSVPPQIATSPLVSSPKVRKLLKSDIQVSSSIIADQLNRPDTINQIIAIAIKQLPKDSFVDNFSDETDILFNDQVYNAFFYSIKETLLNGPGAASPLAEYLQDKLPILIRGPGKLNSFDGNYLKFLDIQFNLNDIIQVVLALFNRFILRLQLSITIRQNEAASLRQLEQHKKTQDMIADRHTETLNEFQSVKDQLAIVTSELNERKQKEQAALAAKERRKQRNRLPVRDAISEQEYLRLNEFCNNLVLTDTAFETKFRASFLKLAYFLLQASGMRVSNLFQVRLRDIEELISNKNNPVILIPLIKSPERKYVHIAIDAYVRRNYLFNDPYNIANAFDIIKQHASSWLSLKSRSPDDYLDFPLAATYKNPDKPMSREYLTKSLNNTLNAINTDKFGKPSSSQPKTSHGFRIAVIDKITQQHGVEAARDFVQHEDIQTTDRYIRSRLTDQKRRQITSTLFNSSRKDAKNKPPAKSPDSEESDSNLDD